MNKIKSKTKTWFQEEIQGHHYVMLGLDVKNLSQIVKTGMLLRNVSFRSLADF